MECNEQNKLPNKIERDIHSENKLTSVKGKTPEILKAESKMMATGE